MSVPQSHGHAQKACFPGEIASEVIEQIGYNVNPADLLALRLTCKTISNAIVKPFVKANFETRKHIYSRRSLQALVEITEHPTLGPFVKHVSLSSGRLSARTRDRLVHNLQKLYEMPQDDIQQRRVQLAKIARLRSMIVSFCEQRMDQGSLDSGLAKSLLVRAFKGIGRLNKPISLGIFDNSLSVGVTKRRGWGTEDWVSEGLDGPELFAMYSDFFDTANLLVSAAVQAQCPLDALTTHHSSPTGELGLPANILENFQRLKIILPMETAFSDDSDYSFKFPYAQSIERLDLANEPPSRGFETTGSGFSHLLQKARFSRLRELTLVGTTDTLDNVIVFLRKHKSTLRRLTINNHGDADGESWATFLGWILVNLELQELTIGNLITGHVEHDRVGEAAAGETGTLYHTRHTVDLESYILDMKNGDEIESCLNSLIKFLWNSDGRAGLGQGWLETYSVPITPWSVADEQWLVDED